MPISCWRLAGLLAAGSKTTRSVRQRGDCLRRQARSSEVDAPSHVLLNVAGGEVAVVHHPLERGAADSAPAT